MPNVALFGLAVILLSAGSSSGQSMIRYVLAVPAIFLMLAWFGRHPVFDRAWTMASTLLMGSWRCSSRSASGLRRCRRAFDGPPGRRLITDR